MLRLIARIDSRNGYHIKTINCEGVQKIRPIIDSILKFSNGGNTHDEIIVLDSVASLYGFKNWLLKQINEYFYCQIPLSIGGAIGSVSDATATLHKGADKIAINTAAINNPKLIEQISRKCGRQAVILQIEAKLVDKKFMCFTHGARELSKYSSKEWISAAQDYGAGEIHLTSIDAEGTSKNFPEELAELSKESTQLPLIISGGIRSSEQISRLNRIYGIDSFSMSSITNVCKRNLIDIRKELIELGHEIRTL